MYKTKERNKRTDNNYLAVNGDTLAGILDCGRATAVKIGTDAGAKIQIGNRVLSLKTWESRFGCNIQFIDSQYSGYYICSTFSYFCREALK